MSYKTNVLIMPKEIERKFLINHAKWKQVEKPIGDFYRQGYLLTDPNKTIRVRLTNTSAFLTIKGLSVGATRPEFEYEIPMQDAKELLDNFAVSELSKVRYKINFNNKLWEVDEFLGNNLGLIVAEIELKSENETFDLPDWIDREVTGKQKYYNSNLTIVPFKDWEG
jgi:adenylate cyclase